MVINKGSGLENTVAEIYLDLGYNVEQNVILTKSISGKKIRAQIDLTYNTLAGKRYVECKLHKKKPVSLEEVSKFYAVLDMFGIPSYNGEMITNNRYTQRAIEYAQRKGLSLIDGNGLSELEQKRKCGVRTILLGVRAAGEYKKRGLFGVIDYVSKRMQPLEKQIKEYMK
jgi:hypothetical protein